MADPMIVADCSGCPWFVRRGTEAFCDRATRPFTDDERVDALGTYGEPPSWCPLRREDTVVRLQTRWSVVP